MTTPPPAPASPPWAQPQGGPPAPGSALDQQFAAFIGPRWARYREKFRPFFDDPRFQPTWNWAAALSIPIGGMWFLYRKLYLPFLFFTILPTIVFGLLWGGEVPMETVPNPLDPAAAPMSLPAQEPRTVLVGIVLSTMILAGGTANYLLFRRATAAMQLLAPREAALEAKLPLLRRVGGVSWPAVGLGLGIMLVIQVMNALGAAATK